MPQQPKKIFKMVVPTGIYRDFTPFSSVGVPDANWFRFYHSRLKKMGGFKYVAGLNNYTINSDFSASNFQQQGNPNTEPSYPKKQYSNQDLTKPYDASFEGYESYNFQTSGTSATWNDNATSPVGYGIPRRITNVVLDGINKIIITADYRQNLSGSVRVDKYGGIAFGGLEDNVSQTMLVDGFFPSRFNNDEPIPGYRPNNTYTWSLDFVNLTLGQDFADTSTYVVVHPANKNGIADPENNYVYIVPASQLVGGELMSPLSADSPVTNLQANTEVFVSGGVCAVGPFLFAYGNNGLIRNSDVNNPIYWTNVGSEDWQFNPGLTNDVNVCNSKIVKGISYRGASNYAALFWSLDSLIMASFIGTPAVFNYTIVATNISIIAPNSVVERSGEYYWIGDGRFFRFSGGQLVEVPNMQNRNWFFSNVNKSREHLIWGCLNPEFNEVWWFFPFGNSEECNHALIYNYEEQTWYDTPLARGAGVYSSVYGKPLWVSNEVTDQQYEVLLHEVGSSYIDKSGNAWTIPSYFITPDLGNLSNSQNGSPKSNGGWLQNWTYLYRVEPDALMQGEWNIAVGSKRFANDPYDYTEFKFNSKTAKIDMKLQGRLMHLKFYSKAVDSDLYLGDFMLTTDLGDSEGF